MGVFFHHKGKNNTIPGRSNSDVKIRGAFLRDIGNQVFVLPVFTQNDSRGIQKLLAGVRKMEMRFALKQRRSVILFQTLYLQAQGLLRKYIRLAAAVMFISFAVSAKASRSSMFILSVSRA